mgnify:CR=1 FL=1
MDIDHPDLKANIWTNTKESEGAEDYDADGNGYLLYCNSGFNMFLIDGKTGEQLDYMNLGGNIEASPAMYGNYAVVGTRAMRTYCIQVG